MAYSYILFGGDGFIGQHLQQALAGESDQIVIIGRKKRQELPANQLFYSVDEHSLDEIAASLSPDKQYRIIDLAYATVPNTSFNDPVKDFSENLQNVINHLEFARNIRADKFIYISSGGTVYGNATDAHIPETAPNYPLSPYGITKMACERYVNLYHVLHGLPTLILRPSNVYGPYQAPFRGQGVIATALALVNKEQPLDLFGDGSIVRDFLYVDDFCAGFKELVQYAGNGEIYNIGYGAGHSIMEVITTINEVVAAENKTLKISYKPERSFDVKRNVLDIRKLSALKGWQPATSLEEGIRKTWAWMKLEAY